MNEFELEKVKILDERINAKIAERDRLYAIATNVSPKPFDDMPRGGSGMVNNAMESAVVNLIALAEEINKVIDQYVDHKNKVIEALEKLPEKEYGVLYRYYIRYMSWDDIAIDMNYSRMQIWRFWKKGLKFLKDVT